MKFTKRKNGYSAATVRITHHIDIEFVACVVAREGGKYDVWQQEIIEKLSKSYVEDAVRSHLSIHGYPYVEDYDDDFCDQLIPLLREMYGVEE